MHCMSNSGGERSARTQQLSTRTRGCDVNLAPLLGIHRWHSREWHAQVIIHRWHSREWYAQVINRSFIIFASQEWNNHPVRDTNTLSACHLCS